MYTVVVFAASMFVTYIGVGLLRHSSKSGDTTMVHDRDPELDAAIEMARRTTKHFVDTLSKPPPNAASFAVRIRLVDGSKSEFVWLDHITYDHGVFHGTIKDKPALVTAYRQGQSMSVPEGEIADWIIVYRGDKPGETYQEGDQTDRVFLRRQSLGMRAVRLPALARFA